MALLGLHSKVPSAEANVVATEAERVGKRDIWVEFHVDQVGSVLQWNVHLVKRQFDCASVVSLSIQEEYFLSGHLTSDAAHKLLRNTHCSFHGAIVLLPARENDGVVSLGGMVPQPLCGLKHEGGTRNPRNALVAFELYAGDVGTVVQNADNRPDHALFTVPVTRECIPNLRLKLVSEQSRHVCSHIGDPELEVVGVET